MSREAAYAAVQRNAMQVWRDGGQFIDVLKADQEVSAQLTDAELADLFDPAWHFAHVDTIFERVFGADAVTAKAAAE